MTSGIYEIRNMVNGHRYIGSSSRLQARKIAHFIKLRKGEHPTKHMQCAFNLYGEENFIFTVLYECEPDELIRCEQEELDLLKPEYNIRKIAENNRGLKASEETKRKMSMSRTGMFVGVNNPLYGTHHTEEQKKIVSEKLKGKFVSEETKQKISVANKGKRNSDEAIQRMRNTKKGKKLSEEHKKKISMSEIGKKTSNETKLKQSISAKKHWDRVRAERGANDEL